MSHGIRMHTPPTIPVLVARIAALTTDLKSAHLRNRTFMRLLRESASAPTVVSAIAGPNREFDEIVFLSNGVRLEHRWTEEGWTWIETHVPNTPAAIVSEALGLEHTISGAVTGEMAVVGDALPAELIARLERVL
jgi:hypothetical protein